MERVDFERALAALHAVAAEIEPLDDSLPEFLGRLSAAVAGLLSARRVGFFLLDGESLGLADDAFGIDAVEAAGLRQIPCRPGRGGTVERIVFEGRSLRVSDDSSAADVAQFRRWFAPLGSSDVVAVPWAAGNRRLGLVAAFGADLPGGFTAHDAWVLEASAVTAALVWQQRQLAGEVMAARSEETQRMRTLAKRMTELEELKGHVLNLAAHELRGPIAVIRGYLSMVADSSLDIEGLRRVMPILLAKVGQMDSQVTQMLEVARLEEGRIELATVPMDLGAVVREVVEVAGLLSPAGISVLLERSPEPVMVQADPVRVATIIGNLIDNAVKYSPDGGLIKCTVRREGGRAAVTVEDHGLGIAATDRARLFSRFGRILTPENSHIGGTGLGLHLSRELARLHGGDIEVASVLGAGSTFKLLLPLLPRPSVNGDGAAIS